INFPVPYRHATIGARGIGAVQSLIQTDLRVVLPEEFSRGSFHGIDLRKGRADINDAVDDDGFGDHDHRAVVIEIPSETDIGDVRRINLLERAEMFRIIGSSVHQPVDSRDGISGEALVVHIAGLYRSGSRGRLREMQGESHSDREKDKTKTQDSPCLHASNLSPSLRAPAAVMRESRPTPIGAELSVVMLGA